MATLIKDKNYLVFTNNKDNVYKFDMSKGVFISTRGNVMKTTPVGFPTYMNNLRMARNREMTMVENYLYQKHQYNVPYNDFSRYANYLLICDKLDSIGYAESRYSRIREDELDFINDNFKAFAKQLKNNAELTMADFRRNYGKTQFFIKLGIKEDTYYTHDILDILWDIRQDFTEDNLKLVAYYLSRGAYEVFENDTYRYGFHSKIFKDFFRWSAIIGHTPTKDDFFKQYIQVKRTYRVHKAEFDNKSIEFNLGLHKKSWEFENDEYIVVVPKTTDDFKDEANQQGNCVYSMYLEKVVNGNTNVVFIRKKNDITKSHITCEVDNEGYIRQYLLKHNGWVDTNSSENAFRRAFDEHIRNTW